MKRCTNNFDVIIVGSGMAGLQCGVYLLDNGIKNETLLILDAQDYIGGRVKQDTCFVSGRNVELGAEFIHGNASPAYHMSKELNLEMDELFCTAHGDGGPDDSPVGGRYSLYYHANGNRLLRFDEEEDDEFVRTNNVLFDLVEVDEHQTPNEITLQDYLNQNYISPSMSDMASAGFSNTLCANSNELSLKTVVRWTKDWKNDEGEFILKDSYAGIVNHLMRNIGNIWINCSVSSIEYDRQSSPEAVQDEYSNADLKVHSDESKLLVEDAIAVTFRRGNNQGKEETVYGKRVVVTASAHVMQRGLIHFQPPLPADVTRAWQSMRMNAVCKVVLKFARRPWPAKLQGMICAGTLVPEFWFKEYLYTCKEVEVNSGTASSSSSGSSSGSSRSSSASSSASASGDDTRECYVAVGYCAANYAENIIRLYSSSSSLSTATSFSSLEDGRMPAGPTKRIAEQVLLQMEDMFSLLRPTHMHADASAGTMEDVLALPKASSCFQEALVYEWSERTHPFIGGGYASPLAGKQGNDTAENYQQIIARPLSRRSKSGIKQPLAVAVAAAGTTSDDHEPGHKQNRVFFAGEATAAKAGATVEAAMESGIRAAKEILLSLDMDTVTSTAPTASTALGEAPSIRPNESCASILS